MLTKNTHHHINHQEPENGDNVLMWYWGEDCESHWMLATRDDTKGHGKHRWLVDHNLHKDRQDPNPYTWEWVTKGFHAAVEVWLLASNEHDSKKLK